MVVSKETPSDRSSGCDRCFGASRWPHFSAASSARAQRIWGNDAVRILSAGTFLLCPLLAASISWTCPGVGLTRAAVAAGAVCAGAVILFWGYALLHGQLFAAMIATYITVAIVWSPQGIVFFGTVAYFGGHSQRVRQPNGEDVADTARPASTGQCRSDK